MSRDRARARKLPLLPRELRRPPLLEKLEPRSLMASDTSTVSLENFTAGHGMICGCPVCRGMLNNIPQEASTVGGVSNASTAKSPLSALPLLHSNASARVKIYLDFDGNTQSQWGQYSNVRTPVFDQDGDFSTFSDQELATIREVWARVSEDYAPFNVDVTTQDPGSFADGQAIRVAIGGNYSDWFGQQAGGVAYVGAFANSAPNVAYVFSDALGHGNARYVAEAASHEVGHTFGLMHQSSYNGTAKSAEYNQGNATWAPIMGVGYYSSRTTWHNGQTTSSTTYQDDMALIASQTNGFGYRADDYGNTTAASRALTFAGANFSVNGILETNGDVDTFRFTTSGGSATFNLNVAQFGTDLDSVLELRDANGNLIVSANPTDQLGASLTRTLSSGTYYVMVKSSGGYGNVGQYTVSGTIGGVTQAAPEIAITTGGVEIADGGSVAFGSTQTNTALDRVFTVTNTGGGTLTLTALSQANLPAGFTIVSNIGSTSLAAGQSTSFTVRFQSTVADNFSGRISLSNNDSNEGPYDLNVSGTATAPVVNSSVRVVDDGAAGFSSTGGWTLKTGVGRESDQRTAGPAGSVSSATWNFDNTQAGQYRVAVTWSGVNTANASNAPFAIYDNGTLIAVVRVSQRGAAGGFTDGGSAWVSLGTFNFTSNRIMVVLTNSSANGGVVADAVRIERVASSSAVAKSETIGESDSGGEGQASGNELTAYTTVFVNGAAGRGTGATGGGSESDDEQGSSQSVSFSAQSGYTLPGAVFSFAASEDSFDEISDPQDAEGSSFDAVFGSDASDDLLPAFSL